LRVQGEEHGTSDPGFPGTKELKKSAVRKLRESGSIPAVVYGQSGSGLDFGRCA